MSADNGRSLIEQIDSNTAKIIYILHEMYRNTAEAGIRRRIDNAMTAYEVGFMWAKAAAAADE